MVHSRTLFAPAIWVLATLERQKEICTTIQCLFFFSFFIFVQFSCRASAHILNAIHSHAFMVMHMSDGHAIPNKIESLLCSHIAMFFLSAVCCSVSSLITFGMCDDNNNTNDLIFQSRQSCAFNTKGDFGGKFINLQQTRDSFSPFLSLPSFIFQWSLQFELIDFLTHCLCLWLEEMNQTFRMTFRKERRKIFRYLIGRGDFDNSRIVIRKVDDVVCKPQWNFI